MANFQLALPVTLHHEGGFQDDPKDKGNWYAGKNFGTKYGITPEDVAKHWPALIADPNCVRNLTTEQASEIYEKDYWNPLYDQIADQSLATKLFDMGVLFGKETAVKLFQISMTADGEITLVSDGDFGNETLADANKYGSIPNFRSVLLNHCMDVVSRNPEDGEFLQGWIERINS